MWISCAAKVRNPWWDIKSVVFEHFFAFEYHGLTPDDKMTFDDELSLVIKQGNCVWDSLSHLIRRDIMRDPTKKRYTLEDAQCYAEGEGPTLFFQVGIFSTSLLRHSSCP